MLVGANRGRFNGVLYAGKVRSLHKISLRPKITGAGGNDGIPKGLALVGQGDVAGRLDRRLCGVLVRLGALLALSERWRLGVSFMIAYFLSRFH